MTTIQASKATILIGKGYTDPGRRGVLLNAPGTCRDGMHCFTPARARELAYALLAEADEADAENREVAA